MTHTAKNKPNSLFSRAIGWLKKPSSERNRLLLLKLKTISVIPFYFGKATLLKIFIAYQPDSHILFNAHPEFNILFNKFTKQNKLNNAGDVARLWSFILNIKQIIAEKIEGDFAELGVWRGNTASILAYFATSSNRKVLLFDTYEGFNKKDLAGIDAAERWHLTIHQLLLLKMLLVKKAMYVILLKDIFLSL